MENPQGIRCCAFFPASQEVLVICLNAYLKKRIAYFYLGVHVFVCMSMCHMCAHREQKRGLDIPELELQWLHVT